jgi:hypothetical protein
MGEHACGANSDERCDALQIEVGARLRILQCLRARNDQEAQALRPSWKACH